MLKKRVMITQSELKKVLRYDPKTGEFTRLVRTGPTTQPGQLAGCKISTGHIHIKILGHRYYAHRLAWLYMTGSWPTGEIDHKNGIGDDNHWENLRDCTHSFNLQNQRKANRNNRTGYLGVSPSPHGKGFIATIFINGKNKNLGKYETAEQAHQIYISAKRRFHSGGTL